MNAIFNTELYHVWFLKCKDWMLAHVLILDNLIHVAVQVAILLVARLAGSIIGRWLRRIFAHRLAGHEIGNRHLAGLIQSLLRQTPLILSIFLLWIGIRIAQQIDTAIFLMNLVLNLSVAWVAIQLATSVILDRFWSRIIAVSAWFLAALNILGILDETVSLLESIGFTVGDVRLTVLSLSKAAVILLLLLRVMNWFGGYLDQRLAEISELTPSTRLMMSKVIHICLLVLVTLVALNSVGIDLTALAVFSGAVGVGVGFGLQKVVGNFISGLILLSDKSIKPGDVVQLGDVYGWVNHMGGRCVSVVTRDEKEYLIPNEDLITQQVINWSYSSRRIRVKVPFGVSYRSEPQRVMDLVVGSIHGIPRVLGHPEPKCLLVGFGDSSVDLQLRFWIEDPQNGVANVTSDVMLRIWDTLRDNHIEIPFPQRDVHLDTASALHVSHAASGKKD